METRENYLARIGETRPSAALGRRIVIGGSSCVRKSGQTSIVDPENRVTVLVRDLGTLTPYKELGRGRP